MEYLFFDTALNGYFALAQLKDLYPHYLPLMPEEEKISEHVAPFIFQKEDLQQEQQEKINKVEINDWMLVTSDMSLQEMKDYFEQQTVQLVKGRNFYFRFWSAKVFSDFIGTCDSEQLKIFFPGNETYIASVKGEKTLNLFKCEGHKLISQKISYQNFSGPFSELSIVKNETVKENVSNSKETESVINTNIQKKTPRKFFY